MMDPQFLSLIVQSLISNIQTVRIISIKHMGFGSKQCCSSVELTRTRPQREGVAGGRLPPPCACAGCCCSPVAARLGSGKRVGLAACVGRPSTRILGGVRLSRGHRPGVVVSGEEDGRQSRTSREPGGKRDGYGLPRRSQRRTNQSTNDLWTEKVEHHEH